jgi:DNA (cytosine-5)-methyltransferase 1
MVSLSYLDEDHENDARVLEGAGMVASMSEGDEDEEDDLDDEPQFIRITNILGYSIDYTEDEEWVISNSFLDFLTLTVWQRVQSDVHRD